MTILINFQFGLIWVGWFVDAVGWPLPWAFCSVSLLWFLWKSVVSHSKHSWTHHLTRVQRLEHREYSRIRSMNEAVLVSCYVFTQPKLYSKIIESLRRQSTAFSKGVHGLAWWHCRGLEWHQWKPLPGWLDSLGNIAPWIFGYFWVGPKKHHKNTMVFLCFSRFSDVFFKRQHLETCFS